MEKSLSREQKTNLRRLIGKPPKNLVGGPTLILMTNGRDDYEDALSELERNRARVTVPQDQAGQ